MSTWLSFISCTWRNDCKKKNSDSQTLVATGPKELEIKYPDQGNSCKSESNSRKMSTKIQSGHEGMKKFKCEICTASYGQKGHL